MGVYKGIAQDNVTINSGTLYNATVQFRNATAAEIAAKANVVNTVGKRVGTAVFDVTNSKLKIATGATNVSTWVDADGTNAVTPA